MVAEIMNTRHRAEQIAASLPPLLLAAQRVAATVMQGLHGRRRAGTGETFWQFRRYESGDSATLIDWRQSAKSDHLFVREQEWEAAASIWLWCDSSPSMRYRQRGLDDNKGRRAQLLMLAMATLLLQAGEQIALLGDGRRPMRGISSLGRFAQLLGVDADTPDADVNAGAASASIPPQVLLPGHGQVALIGDFLSPLKQVDDIVTWYARAGIHGHIMQILDPDEETLPFSGRIRFEGLEDEGSLTIGRVESVRAAYQDRVRTHREGLADIARKVGWTFTTHSTDRPPELALMTIYLALAARSESGRRG